MAALEGEIAMANPHLSGLYPPMSIADVYVYAHGNGAISVLHGDDTWRGSVTLADAQLAVRNANESGARAWVAGDDSPLAIDTLVALSRDGVHVEAFEPDGAPHEWLHQSTALMEATKERRFALVRDLIDRSADIHQVNSLGLTALHYAAAHGDDHSIAALLTAGARPEVENPDGHTSYDLAEMTGDEAAMALLAPADQDSDEQGRATRVTTEAVLELPTSTIVNLYAGAVIKALSALIVIAILIGAFTVGTVADLPYALGTAAVFVLLVIFSSKPSRIAGGAPRRIIGTDIMINRPFRLNRSVDLAAGGLIAATRVQQVNRADHGRQVRAWPWQIWVAPPGSKVFAKGAPAGASSQRELYR